MNRKMMASRARDIARSYKSAIERGLVPRPSVPELKEVYKALVELADIKDRIRELKAGNSKRIEDLEKSGQDSGGNGQELFNVKCSYCDYESRSYRSEDEAIAAHNRVCRAVSVYGGEKQ